MKSIRTIIFLIFLSSTCFTKSTPPTLPWNILIYMEASAGGLYQAAFKNLNEIISNAPDHAHIFVFLHTHNNTGWLYKITKNNMYKIADIDCEITVAETLITVMQQVVENGPAEQNGIIFWNHGYGILDPIFDELKEQWSVPYDGPYAVSCILKRSPLPNHGQHKGICTTNNETFLSNNDMVFAFEVICNELLDGKRFAFCGMDLCKGSMLEHAYQLQHYADFLIGSQECEMIDGWPYDTILQILQDNPRVCSEELTQHIVTMYHNYYEKHTQHNMYTLSSLDLDHVQALTNNVDLVAYLLTGLMVCDNSLQQRLEILRKNCKTFCDAPMYCDLHQWYKNLLFSLVQYADEYSDEYTSTELIDILRNLLIDGLNIMSYMTVAHCNGSSSTHAHGCSIYFPRFAIDESYLTTPFAQDSLWLQFLKKFLA